MAHSPNLHKKQRQTPHRTVLGLLHAVLQLFFPRYCIVCDAPLSTGEELLCTHCNIALPRTDLHLKPENAMADACRRVFSPKRATAFINYHKEGKYRALLHILKYGRGAKVGVVMGRMMAAELMGSGFFEGVDCLVPIPLHPAKQRKRGYNQSELIAQGISLVTGIPVDSTSVVRCKNTLSQTGKSRYQRQESMRDAFRLLHPQRFEGKHILLVDDVFTTGATINACAEVFGQSGHTTLSVLTLARTQL